MESMLLTYEQNEPCNQSQSLYPMIPGDVSQPPGEYLINGTLFTADQRMPEYIDDPSSSSSSSSPGLHSPDVFYDDATHLPLYLRITCLILFVVIFSVGTVGNIMVTLVISWSRDMRTSTNIFLVNLSIADLLVLVICTPTALIEVTYHPDRWVLGFYMCKFVPLLETTVANTSVLTILAISFERFYAICRPLKANYICTKSRAAMICLAAWILATFITSPMIFMIKYSEGVNECGDWSARCYVTAGQFWPDSYTISTIFLFFILPFFILLVTYGMIAKRLTSDRSALNAKNENHKARKQVVLMLGTVVFTFFLCLLPFRVLTLFVLLVDTKMLDDHAEAYQNALYFSRIMIYLNSALNPILYNIMSSKFRNGFLRLCSRGRRKHSPFTRTGTFITNTTTNSTNASINLGHQPTMVNGIFIGKGNGYGHHHSLGHCSSVHGRKNGYSASPQLQHQRAGPDLLKTLIRTQSNCSTASFAIVTPSTSPICSTPCSTSPQCYTSHATSSTTPNGIRLHQIMEVNGVKNNFKKKPQSQQPNGNGKGVNCGGSSLRGTNLTYSNGDNRINGKHMTVKSDTVYTAYLQGKRSETVL